MHKIGVLDSGIGGLTICSYIFKIMPDVDILYYADTLNAPYGNKTKDEVYDAVRAGVEYLVASDCDAVVIACNTATTTCIDKIRAEFSLPVIGISPNLDFLKNGEIPLLLATPLTYQNQSEKVFKRADTSLLSSVIERAVLCDEILKKLAIALVPKCENYVVLGCTHYLYLERFLDCSVFDGGEKVARDLKRRVIGARKSKRGGNLFLAFSGQKYFSKYLLAFDTFDNFNRFLNNGLK